MRILYLHLFLWFSIPTFAQETDSERIPLPKTYRYRLTLTDKAGSPYSLNHPEQFYDFYFNRMVFKATRQNGHLY